MYSGLFEFSHFARCLMNSRHLFLGVSSVVEPSQFLDLNSFFLRTSSTDAVYFRLLVRIIP